MDCVSHLHTAEHPILPAELTMQGWKLVKADKQESAINFGHVTFGFDPPCWEVLTRLEQSRTVDSSDEGSN